MKDTPKEFTGEWNNVLAAADHATDAYREFLDASDGLAVEMGLEKEWVLAKVVPKNRTELREFSLDAFLESQKEDFQDRIRVMREREKQSKLIEKLGLSAADLELLRKRI